jgi:hypothetical protein
MIIVAGPETSRRRSHAMQRRWNCCCHQLWMAGSDGWAIDCKTNRFSVPFSNFRAHLMLASFLSFSCRKRSLISGQLLL